MKPLRLPVLLAFTPLGSAAPLVFEGTHGPGVGRHIIFLAGDHESRSAETLIVPCRLHLTHPDEPYRQETRTKESDGPRVMRLHIDPDAGFPPPE